MVSARRAWGVWPATDRQRSRSRRKFDSAVRVRGASSSVRTSSRAATISPLAVSRQRLAEAGDLQQLLHRGVADAALGRVDDPLEGQVVVRRLHLAQIGVGVADLGPFEEARAADHRIGDLQHDEAFFEGAHLERSPHQDRRLAITAPAPRPALDVVGDQPAFRLAVPDPAHLNLAAFGLGPQGLAQPALVGGDEASRGGEDMGGGAVVALQAHHLGAREIALEAQDVVHLGAAPAIDRLVVVADAAEVLPPLRQQPQPQVLGDVGVLVFVHQKVAEARVIVGQHVRMAGEDGQVVQQQVAEVAGVQHPQAVLVGGVEHRAAVVGEVGALRRPAACAGTQPRFFHWSTNPAK